MSSSGSWLNWLTLSQRSDEAPNIAGVLARQSKKEDAMVREAARAEAEAIQRRRKAASTIFTSPSGVTGTPTTTHTLLGE